MMRLFGDRGKGRAGAALAATFATALVLFDSTAFADPLDRNTDEPALRILPWTAPVPQKALLDLLKERDRRDGLQGLGHIAVVNRPSLLEGASRLTNEPLTAHRPLFGTFKIPYGRMSLVSEKIDAAGRVSGLDFLRVEIPNWDIGVKGNGLKISHKWGKTGGERPFANKDKKKLRLPD